MQTTTLVTFEHRKLVFVKVGSGVIKKSENVHWSRLYWDHMDHMERSTRRHLFKKN